MKGSSIKYRVRERKWHTSLEAYFAQLFDTLLGLFGTFGKPYVCTFRNWFWLLHIIPYGEVMGG